MISAGRVLLMPKGDYDPTATYEMLDIVSYDRSSYIAKGTTTGNLPTNTTYWQLLAYGGQASNLAGNFAPLETTAYASRAYATDDIFVDKDSQLVIATDAINIGDEIEIGSNCDVTTMAELLDAIENRYDALDQRNRKLIGITQLTAQTDLHLLVPGEYYKKLTNFYVTNAPIGINQVLTAVFRLTVESGLDESGSSLLLTLRTVEGEIYTQAYDGSVWSDWRKAGDVDSSNLGTAAAKDSTNAVTQSSTDLIESGAVYTGLDSKFDKTGGNLSGTTTVVKTSTTESASLRTHQINSSTGDNWATLFADSEGGNLRFEKAGTIYAEFDSQPMNGSTGHVRLYTGVKNVGINSGFYFYEDGSFGTSNGFDTKKTLPFMPIYATTAFGRGAITDALNVDLTGADKDLNKVGHCYYGGTINIPSDFIKGIREVFYYNTGEIMVKLRGDDNNFQYGEWANIYENSAWNGWKRLDINGDPLDVTSEFTWNSNISDVSSAIKCRAWLKGKEITVEVFCDFTSAGQQIATIPSKYYPDHFAMAGYCQVQAGSYPIYAMYVHNSNGNLYSDHQFSQGDRVYGKLSWFID